MFGPSSGSHFSPFTSPLRGAHRVSNPG
jgi:hypothetical protein